MDEIRQKIQRLKIKSELLIAEGKRAFIIDIHEEWFSCEILEQGENKISFKPFRGNSEGEIIERYWSDIKSIEEYEEKTK